MSSSSERYGIGLEEVEKSRMILTDLWTSRARGINYLQALVEAWDEYDEEERKEVAQDALSALLEVA